MFVILYVLTIFSAYGAPAAISQHRDEDGCERAFKDIVAQRDKQNLKREASHTCSRTEVFVPGLATTDPAGPAVTDSTPPRTDGAKDATVPRPQSTSDADYAGYRRFCVANPMLPNCRGTNWSEQPATNR